MLDLLDARIGGAECFDEHFDHFSVVLDLSRPDAVVQIGTQKNPKVNIFVGHLMLLSSYRIVDENVDLIVRVVQGVNGVEEFLQKWHWLGNEYANGGLWHFFLDLKEILQQKNAQNM